VHIFIDESGSFTFSDALESWNTVSAYVVPERSRARAEKCLADTKIRHGVGVRDEVKLKDIGENGFLRLLDSLQLVEGALFCSAIDMGRESPLAVEAHKLSQVEKIRAPIDRLLYEAARQGIEALAARTSLLPAQLYVQLVVQSDLVATVLNQAMLYFVQRNPATLGAFRWRVDQKHAGHSMFETAFSGLAPPLLQSRSLRDPGIFLVEADYRHFNRKYALPDGPPSYLKEEYGIDVEDPYNLKLVLREDFKFVDSNACAGVQIADLLASGMRRCLRGQFDDNKAVAASLGALMVQRTKRSPPLSLVSLTERGLVVSPTVGTIKIIHDNCRPMLTRMMA
jgi:hypothetical protein